MIVALVLSSVLQLLLSSQCFLVLISSSHSSFVRARPDIVSSRASIFSRIMSEVDQISIDPAIDNSILNASRDTFLAKNCSPDGRPFDKVVVGGAVFRYDARDGSATAPRLLLLKRADHEAYFPGVFEIPGGKVDAQDASIKQAVAREVFEESGLVVTKFLGELKPMLYTTEKIVDEHSGCRRVVVKRATQLNYVVVVSRSEVTLNANEHSESIWAFERDLDHLRTTDEMRKVIKEAFERFGV